MQTTKSLRKKTSRASKPKITLSVYTDEDRVRWVLEEMKRTNKPMNAVIARAIDCLRAHSDVNRDAIREIVREEVEEQRIEDHVWIQLQIQEAVAELRKEMKR